jgi:hypothetical protein
MPNMPSPESGSSIAQETTQPLINKPIHQKFGRSIIESQRSPEKYGNEPVLITNFVNRGNPLPDWYEDHYLNKLSVHMMGKGESALVFKLPKGFREYYAEVGTIENTDQIIEIAPQMPQNGEPINLSYPQGDLLIRYKQLAAENKCKRLDGGVLVASIIDQHVLDDAQDAGIITLEEQPHSHLTNDKNLFRRDGKSIDQPQIGEKQYSILPGLTIPERVSIEDAIKIIPEELKNAEDGVWVKLSSGSGGDTVKYIEKFSQKSFEEAVEYLRGEILKAHEMGDFGISGEDAWPNGRLSPPGSTLIVESDIKNHAEGQTFLGSNFFMTRSDGSHETYGYYEQRTDNGSFNGSRKHHPDEETRRLIDEQTSLVAKQAITEGYFGPQGLDYFIFVNKETQKPQIVLIERNGRPPISAYAEIVGRKLGINNWVNLNITFPEPISSIEDFDKATGELMFKKGNKTGVFPLASRTIVGKTDEQILASPHMKILILGTPEEQQEQIKKLEEKGAKLGTHGPKLGENVIYTI